MVTLSVAGEDYVRLSVTDFGGALPLTVATAWLESLAFGPAVILLAGVMPLYFPDGRLPSRRWRWVVWIAAFGIVVGILQPAFAPGSLGNTTIDNPLGIPAFHDLDGLLALANVLLVVVVLPLAIASTILKYRRGSSTIREQLKWFGAVALLTVAGFIAGAVGIAPISAVGGFFGILGLVLLPIAVGIAILRYRLYDIDRIISRTVSYGAVTGILAVVFVGTILGLQTVSCRSTAAARWPSRRPRSSSPRSFNRCAGGSSQSSIGGSTARAMTPNGRPPPSATHLRDEVDLANLDAEVRQVVAATVAPVTVGLWIRHGGAGP